MSRRSVSRYATVQGLMTIRFSASPRGFSVRCIVIGSG
ncbi:Uncharacterised protein [Mycobacteroides abscessus subsp. abscessus]|nr:Uncharacterised protein [Mycobacteroides abscessus subsp. abscessus]